MPGQNGRIVGRLGMRKLVQFNIGLIGLSMHTRSLKRTGLQMAWIHILLHYNMMIPDTIELDNLLKGDVPRGHGRLAVRTLDKHFKYDVMEIGGVAADKVFSMHVKVCSRICGARTLALESHAPFSHGVACV